MFCSVFCFVLFYSLFNESLKTLNPQILSPDNEFWSSDLGKVIRHWSKLLSLKSKCFMSVSHNLVAGYLDRLLEAVSRQCPVGFLKHLCISYHSSYHSLDQVKGWEGENALTFNSDIYKICEIPFWIQWDNLGQLICFNLGRQYSKPCEHCGECSFPYLFPDMHQKKKPKCRS